MIMWIVVLKFCLMKITKIFQLEESVITSNDELMKKARTKKELRNIGKN